MTWVGVVIAVAALSACKRTSGESGEACLPLPSVVRSSLTASPDGQTLYWAELVRTYDFDADLELTYQLVHYDPRTRRSEIVLDDIAGPIVFVGGDLITVQGTRAPRLVLVARGHVQVLTPTSLDVLDVEVFDPHTLVFLADGTGARAVYLLDLGEQRPVHLIDADTLLSTSGGRVFARVDDDVVAIDVKTRATTSVPWIKKSLPQGGSLVYVDKSNVMRHDMLTSTDKPLLTALRDWKLVYQGETTLARSPVKDKRSYAYLLQGDTVRGLPTIAGGASILLTANLGKQTWALVGHNTQNFVGDLAETNAETDVCRLDASSEITLPTRSVPQRFSAQAEKLFAAVKAASPDWTMQVSDNGGEPTTLYVEMNKVFGARDLDDMRKRIRAIHDDVTRLLTDREIRTEVLFDDRRHALHRWRRDRSRTRTLVGMGDALITDPADFDFEVTGIKNEKADDKITCSGTLRNLTKRALPGIDIKCSGNRSHLIHLDKLGVDEARTFDQTFDVSDDGEEPYIQVMLDGRASEPRDADGDATRMTVFMLATDVYAATRLWLTEHVMRDDQITVWLMADRDFLKLDDAKQEAAVRAAFDRYVGLREIYGYDAKTPVVVRVHVRLSETSFRYDGSQFTRDD